MAGITIDSPTSEDVGHPAMQYKFLFLNTYYPEFLDNLYASDPSLAGMDYESQHRKLFATGFGVSDAYSHGLELLGCSVHDVVVNADHLQAQWADEHGVSPRGNIHDVRREIVAAQIDHFRPEVLYVFEWCPVGDAFLADIKSKVRMLAGQIASPLPDNRSFAAYDLMISSWPPLVDHFRSTGTSAELLKLAFDARMLDRIELRDPVYDVTFVGGFAPSHTHRVKWLERLLKEVDVDVFGYGRDQLPAASSIHDHHRGEVWGTRMYEVIQRSRITLNCHAGIDIRGGVSRNFANNMRLYEATGVGSCLITESRHNLYEILKPMGEVLTYENEDECLERIRYYLANDKERESLARAGQQRTLKDHTYPKRMAELLEVIQRHLS